MTSPTAIPPQLASLLAAEGIPHSTPSSPDFADVYPVWLISSAVPLAVVRPQTAAHVASIVSACAEAGVDLVVRSGGHDTQGRTMVDGVLQLDLRLLDSVAVAADRATARIGGGAAVEHVLAELEKEGLTTARGTVPNVGFAGWASWGGYGPFASTYGLGADLIVGARVVGADGVVSDASPRLLRAMRGGGLSNWGVVVELEVKVFPIQEVQSGMMVYDSSDLPTAMTTYFNNLTQMLATAPAPPNLGLQVFVLTMPGGPGKMLASGFNWNGPADADCTAWQDRVAGLGTCVMRQMATTTPHACLMAGAMWTTPMHGNTDTASVTHFSPAATAALVAAAVALPAVPGPAMVLSMLQPCSPSCGAGREDSVFVVREPHCMIEAIGTGTTAEAAAEASRWATEAAESLARVDAALDATYFPLISQRTMDLKRAFGKNLDELVALKKELDPKGVFKHAVPQL